MKGRCARCGKNINFNSPTTIHIESRDKILRKTAHETVLCSIECLNIFELEGFITCLGCGRHWNKSQGEPILTFSNANFGSKKHLDPLYKYYFDSMTCILSFKEQLPKHGLEKLSAYLQKLMFAQSSPLPFSPSPPLPPPPIMASSIGNIQTGNEIGICPRCHKNYFNCECDL